MQWLTRYFDSLIAPLFKTDDLGRSLYFPAGVWSKGRLLADTVAADRIRMKIRRAYMAFFIGVIPPLAIASPWLTGPRWALIIAVSVIAGLALNAYFFLLARGLPVTDDTLTLGEAYRNQASARARLGHDARHRHRLTGVRFDAVCNLRGGQRSLVRPWRRRAVRRHANPVPVSTPPAAPISSMTWTCAMTGADACICPYLATACATYTTPLSLSLPISASVIPSKPL